MPGLRLDDHQVGRALRGVPGLGHGDRGRLGAGGADHGPSRRRAGPTHRRGGGPTGAHLGDRAERVRSGPGRRPGRRIRRPDGRGARGRQVDPAAGRRLSRGERRAHRPLHHRGGVRGAGPAAGRADRRATAEAAARRRDRPGHGAGPCRVRRPRPAGARLGADRGQRRGGRRCRRRHAGPRGRGGADPPVQVPRHGERAGRARDQGRRDRRPQGAGAPGGRGLPVRGGTAFATAAAALDQEPVRGHRRGRLLRPVRHRDHATA